MQRNTIRQGDTMIAVESRPTAISFEEILEATEVVADDHEYMTPWEHCDGFAHTATPERRFREKADARAMQGSVYCDGHRERLVIELPAEADYGVFDYTRKNGASRQVAAEMVAAARRQTLTQLVKWYGNGWEWWGVTCVFEALGEEYEASVWGIDDPDYAEREVKEEIASEVAYQLEATGYTVTGKPERVYPTRQNKQERLARSMAAQNWKVE